MKTYLNLSKQELLKEKIKVQNEYMKFKKLNLKLDMSRGKPCKEQLDLSLDLLDVLNSKSNFFDDGIDCRNYGELYGLPKMKKLMAKLMGVAAEDVIVGGNSSLSLMFDVMSCFMQIWVQNMLPWNKQNIKFLCPAPGYDRHFAMCEYFGFELIPIKMTPSGPEMNEVEKLVNFDATVKGIWCVPKYSNPQGLIYSDETVRRFAKLKPAAEDFHIFWDNAYSVHDLEDNPKKLLNIMDECKVQGTEKIPIIFCSTSKITFAGGGVAALACKEITLEILQKHFSFKTISFDKLNQLRHVAFLKNLNNIEEHMKKHQKILKPKFNLVISKLNENFKQNPIISWDVPKGGYFISIEIPWCAKRIVELCEFAGLIITPAGAAFPYKNDPKDSNIRLAPTFPPLNELGIAIDLFCVCVKFAVIERLLKIKF